MSLPKQKAVSYGPAKCPKLFPSSPEFARDPLASHTIEDLLHPKRGPFASSQKNDRSCQVQRAMKQVKKRLADVLGALSLARVSDGTGAVGKIQRVPGPFPVRKCGGSIGYVFLATPSRVADGHKTAHLNNVHRKLPNCDLHPF